MIKGIRKIYLIFFFILSINANAIENKILFKVNNEIITSLDIDNEITYLKILNPSIKDLDKKVISGIGINSIIREKIKKIEIKKNTKNLDINKEYLNKLLENIYLKINLESIEEFENYLLINNLNIQFINEKISIEALWNDLIFKKFSSKLKINKENLKKEIMTSKNKITKSFDLLEILFDISTINELDNKYQIIKKDIDTKGFSNAASIHSISDTSKIGGKLGWIDENAINKKIKKEINLLNDGDYSKPIIIPGGALILKLNETKETKIQLNLDEELKKIIKVERNRQLNQFSKLYYNKIKKNIIIDEL
jgi:peptidyl-prolyl cis-trans isomerase SurA